MTSMRKSMMVWPSWYWTVRVVLGTLECCLSLMRSYVLIVMIVCGWSCVKGSFVGVRDFTLTPALSLKGEGAWAPAKAGIQRRGVLRQASFDKLRTNDLLVYLPLSALKGEGLRQASFDKLPGIDKLPSTSFLRQAQDERFTGLPTPVSPQGRGSIGLRSEGVAGLPSGEPLRGFPLSRE